MRVAVGERVGILLITCLATWSWTWSKVEVLAFTSPSSVSSVISTNRITSNTRLMMAATVPTLDNWRITRQGRVIGVVSDHPDPYIEDGELLTTSALADGVEEGVEEGMVVTTASGSRYRLGVKKTGPATDFAGMFKFVGNQKQPKAAAAAAVQKQSVSKASGSIPIASGNTSASSSSSKPSKQQKQQQQSTNKKTAISKKAEEIARIKTLKIEYGITGQTVANGKYLLCANPQRSTSGKSYIYRAYRSNGEGMPVGNKLTIKISPNYEAISREDDNYNRVTSGLFPGRFVNKVEFLPTVDSNTKKSFDKQCALVIEAGRKDLKALLAERNGRGLEGRALRDAAAAAAQCIQAMHSSNIVWTDLKSENFVVVGDEIGDNGSLPGVKGIDLESGMPYKANPVDFSPEACPPEFASAFISGSALGFVLDFSYDMWSYGMMLYELATGRAYFTGKTPAQITKTLGGGDFEADVSDIEDRNLRDLIGKLLQRDPKKRPNVAQVLLHPYFLTTGVGPFGW